MPHLSGCDDGALSAGKRRHRSHNQVLWSAPEPFRPNGASSMHNELCRVSEFSAAKRSDGMARAATATLSFAGVAGATGSGSGGVRGGEEVWQVACLNQAGHSGHSGINCGVMLPGQHMSGFGENLAGVAAPLTSVVQLVPDSTAKNASRVLHNAAGGSASARTRRPVIMATQKLLRMYKDINTKYYQRQLVASSCLQKRVFNFGCRALAAATPICL